MLSHKLAFAAAAMWLCCAAVAEDVQGSRVAVPLGDPSRPALIKAELSGGSITVSGYDGKEVVVEARAAVRQDKTAPESKRIERTTPSLGVSEENNVVRVRVGESRRPPELLIRAPFASSLKLKCRNGGEITADRVEGEIEVEALNGAIVLRNVSGPVLAHALNGGITVVMTKVTPDKPMYFSALNGDIEVTLPSDTKAKVKLETQNGSVHSGFDIKPGRAPDDRSRPRHDGPQKSIAGTLNGGGAEIRLKTLNGNIRLLKGKP
jgi:hypothetical protein